MSEKQSETQDYWHDQWSSTSEVETRDVWYAIDETKMGYLKPYLPESGLSLEVGCGTARLSRFVAGCGLRAVGLDYEPAALKLASQRVGGDSRKLALLLGDAFSLPFGDGSFDVVLSTGLLEHFADPGPIVAEMARVLRPGGLFYSDIVPSKFSLLRMFKGLRRHRNDVWERSFNRHQIEEMLSGQGLCVKKVFAAGIYPPPLPYISRERHFAGVQTKSAIAFGRLSQRLDGTRIADGLGIYYFACAEKPIQEARRQAA